MDADSFDTVARSLTFSGSRRRALAIALGGALTPLLTSTETDAHNALKSCKKKSGKQKKACIKRAKQHNATHASPLRACTPSCSGKVCGDNGCGGSCGSCTGGSICANGACRCDVCASGCRYPSVQAAVADKNGPTTVTVCAGTYQEHLTIDRDVILLGAGSGTGVGDTVLDGTDSGTVVTTVPGFIVTLQNLRITRGRADLGAGITSEDAFLTLTGCTVSQNHAEFLGGGIYSVDGLLVLDASRVTDNSASNDGGGILSSGGTVTIKNGSAVTGNIAGGSGGGIRMSDGRLRLNGADISGNTATGVPADPANTSGQGGGINCGSSTVTLQNGSTVRLNSAVYGGGINNTGGAVTLDASEVTSNTATRETGGIRNLCAPGSTVSIRNGSTVSGNFGGSGGGLSNCRTLTLENSAVTENHATADDGGGISNSGTFTADTSSITGNEAVNRGGGIFNSGGGAATLTGTTVTENSAGTTGGGIFNSGTVTINAGSSVSGNTATNPPVNCAGTPPAAGTCGPPP